MKQHKLTSESKGEAKIEVGDDNSEKKAAIMNQIEELKAQADAL